MSQDLTNPSSSVDFNMSHQSYANLVVYHPYDEHSGLDLYLTDANLGVFGLSTFNGSNVVLSPNLGYSLSQVFGRDDPEGISWSYFFDKKLYLYPYEISTFSAGGPISATGRTEEAYLGELITLTKVVDNFGTDLTYVFTLTPGAYLGNMVSPHIQLTDPNGEDIYLQSLEYNLPTTASTGVYDVHLEWDTGPYQGLLTAESQFEVLPQQTSAIISPDGGTMYSTWDDTLYEFAPGTFTDTVIVTHTAVYTGIPDYAPMLGIGHFYDVMAVYVSSGLPAQPTQPYTITIGYDDWQMGVVIEGSMGLYNWVGAQWVREPTSLVDPFNNKLIATPDHFSTWGILGETNRSFLTLINR